MKDILGKNLSVGNSVAYSTNGYCQLEQGVISKICKKTVKITPIIINSNCYNPELIRDPSGVIKIDNSSFKYFIIVFDVRKKQSYLRRCISQLLDKNNLPIPQWLKKHDSIWYPRSTTFGYYHNFKSAEYLLTTSSEHFSEGETNEYALIEQVPSGPFPSISKSFKEMQWYCLTSDTMLYKKCNRPNHLYDSHTKQFCF